MADPQSKPWPVFRRGQAFPGFRFAIGSPNRGRDVSLPPPRDPENLADDSENHLYLSRTASARATFAAPLSDSGSVGAMLLTRPSRAHFQKPGSIGRWRAQYRGSISIRPGSHPARPGPAKDRRSFAGGRPARSDRARAAQARNAIFALPSV